MMFMDSILMLYFVLLIMLSSLGHEITWRTDFETVETVVCYFHSTIQRQHSYKKRCCLCSDISAGIPAAMECLFVPGNTGKADSPAYIFSSLLCGTICKHVSKH